MKYEIVSLSESENFKYRESFYSLAMEYLPCSDYEKVKAREKDFGKGYLAVVVNCEAGEGIGKTDSREYGNASDEVIGVAFGWNHMLDDPNDHSFCIDGIAVTEKYQKNGIGTKLLTAVCEAASCYGCKSVSVGSAGGYVEKYYINAGFKPICYKVYETDKIVVEKEFENMDDYYSYERKKSDGFVVLEKMLIG